MATGRVYRIKKSAVKGYGYTRPPKKRIKRNGPRFAANGSVTHIAAINGRGSYRTARRTMSGLSANRRPAAARSSLSAAKKAAFAKKMRLAKGKGGVKRSRFRRNDASPAQVRIWERAAARHSDPWGTPKKKRRAKKKTAAPKSRRRKAVSKATRKKPMARKVRRRKKSAARSAPKRRVAKRRTVKRRRKAAKKTVAAPKRRKRRKAKTTLKAKRTRSRRRLKRNKGTSAGARKGWRARKKKYAPTSYRKSTSKRRKSRRKASAVAPKRKRRRSAKRKTARRGKRKLSMKKSAVAARRRRRAAAKGLKPNRRRHRRSRRKMSSNRRRHRSSRRRALSPNRRRRHSRRRMSSNRRRHRRNGRRLFKKNGIGDTVKFMAVTGGLALAGLVGQKVFTNLLVNNVFNKIFGSPAVVVATSPSTTATVAPATSGLGGFSLDPQYQKLAGAALVAGLGIFASTKLIKDAGTRNTVMTGIAVGFTHTLLTAALAKFMPSHADMLNGDGTAARLSAMYGLGAGASLQPRYQSIGRPMGEYFSSGVNGLGEYFSSGVSGLGEYFSSGVSGLGLPAYEAAAGYGANPDFAEAAAGMGARELQNTNHVDPHGDLDRELTITEAAAGVGSLPSYEAAAGFGNVQTLPTSSTWIPGTSDGQIWAGTRSISQPQSATEMVPAGILQTDGGQGVFG